MTVRQNLSSRATIGSAVISRQNCFVAPLLAKTGRMSSRATAGSVAISVLGLLRRPAPRNDLIVVIANDQGECGNLKNSLHFFTTQETNLSIEDSCFQSA